MLGVRDQNEGSSPLVAPVSKSVGTGSIGSIEPVGGRTWSLGPRAVALATVVCLGVVLAAYAVWLLHSVLLLAFLSIMLATSLEPTVKWLRRGPFTHGSGLLVVYSILVVMLAIPTAILVPNAITQGAAFTAHLPDSIAALRQSTASLGPASLQGVVGDLLDQADAIVRRPAAPRGDQIVTVGATAVKAVIDFLTVFVLAYYWLVERASIKRHVLRLVAPDHARHVNTVWVEIEDKLGAWVRGQLLCMLAVGLAAGIGFFAIGLPQPILLGVIAGLCEIVPLIGPLLAFTPAVLVALTVGPQSALAVLIYAIVVQQLESNVLVPRVMSHSVGVSPLTVLLGVLMGTTLAGIWGALVAVPIAAALQVVITYIVQPEPPSGTDSSAATAAS